MRFVALTLLWLLAVLPGGRALAFGNCLDPGYLDRFVTGLPPQPCDEDYYTSVTAATGVATLRVIRLASAPRGPVGDWQPHVQSLAEAVGRAMDALGTLRLPAEITVLMTDRIADTPTDEAWRGMEVHADTTRLSGGECRVVFFKTSTAVSPAAFTFALAHEIFHCVQFENWLSATRDDRGLWWIEGSAEYFAHLAQPGLTLSDAHVLRFDLRSATEPLTALQYENLVFFSWLGQRGGPPAVAEFLSRMRSADQTAVLAGILSADDWTDFVETWLDGGISLPGGGAIRPAPVMTAEGNLRSTVSLMIEAQPFVIARWDLTFPENRFFDVDLQPGGGTLLRGMKPQGSAEPWAEPPAKIDTCAGEKRFTLYHTATEGPATARLDVTVEGDETGGACCLVGLWKPTQETLAGLATEGIDVGAPIIAMAGGSLSCDHDGGGWTLDFASDRTGRISFDGHTTRCSVSAEGQRMTVISERTGQTVFDWAVRGPGNGATRYTGHDVVWSHTMKIGPMSQNTTAPDDGPSGVPGGFAFTCDGDALTIQGLYGLSRFEGEYLRVPVAEEGRAAE